HFDTKIKEFDLTNNMAISLPNVKIDGLSTIIKQWQPVSDAEAPSAEDFGISTTNDSVAASLMPDIEINNVDLRQIFVQYQDASSAMDTKFDIQRLSANIEELDLNKEIVRLKEI